MKLPFILARRFVAGETLDKAFPAVESLLADGLFATLDLLGEHVKDRQAALAYTNEYVDLAQRLAQRRGASDANISIKLSMIGQVIDHDFCVANLKRLLTAARHSHTFVRLDMEGTDLTQSTLDIFEEVYPDFGDFVGVVLQAYLKRTERDVERMCELKARVRLCKGAYGEPPELAHQEMPIIREHFRQYMRMLLLHSRYPGIATHDDELIDATKAFTTEAAIDSNDFEFQMLYGLRAETQQSIVAEGYNMRVYVPYGTQWLPYFSRRLRERKENVGFLVKNLFRK